MLTGTSRGQGTHNTAALSFTLLPASNFAAGAMAVLCIAVDNADTNGAAHSTFTVTDSLGNTWTRRSSPLYDPGAAAAGVEGAIFTTPQNGGALQTGTVITVTFDTNTTAKAWTLQEVAGSVGTPTFKNQSVGIGSATATPTITSASIPNGQMIIGAVFNEHGTAQTPTGDSDTTNGSWSTMQTAEIGTTAAGVTIITQRKVVTATGTQTYNPTLGVSSDVIAAWISIGEDITIDPGLGQATFAGFSPTVQISNNTSISVGLGSATFSGFVPTIQISANVVVDVGIGQATFSGFAPVVQISNHIKVDVGVGQSSFTGFAPSIALEKNITVGLGHPVFGGLQPVVEVSDHKTVNPGLAQSLFTGFAPTIDLAKVVNVGLGQAAFSGLAPTVDASQHIVVSVALGQPVFTGLAPNVDVSISQIDVGLCEAVFTGLAPDVVIMVPVNVRRIVKLEGDRVERVIQGRSGHIGINDASPGTLKIIITQPNTQRDAL